MRYKLLLLILFNVASVFAQEDKLELREFEKTGLQKHCLKVNKINTIEAIKNVSPTQNGSQEDSAIIKKSFVQHHTDSSKILKSFSDKTTSTPRVHFIKNRIEAKKSNEIQSKEILAPGNDDICSAVTLPVDGSCATSQTNASSTSDYYGGCVLSTDRTVWYKFTITGFNNTIDITFTTPGGLGGTSIGQGGNIYTFLMDGTCTVPGGISTICALPSTHFIWYNLTAGTYYLLVATTNANTGNFDICATQSVAATGNQTGPEQDCLGAIPLCNSTYTFAGSYLGEGSVQEVSTSSCLSGGETNSVWYVFTPQSTGSFGFSISTTKDYDFALYDITT